MKVREDDVTKFALIHPDLDSILLKTPTNDHDHVYATLSKYPDVQKQTIKLRESIPNWEKTLASLLQTLGTRSTLKKWKVKNKGLPLKPQPKPAPLIADSEKGDEDVEEVAKTEKVITKAEKKVSVRKVEKRPISDESESDEEPPDEIKEAPKVQDSFFVDKKITLPKLLSESAEKEANNSRDESDRRDDRPDFDQRFSGNRREKRAFKSSFGKDFSGPRSFENDQPSQRNFEKERPGSRYFEKDHSVPRSFTNDTRSVQTFEAPASAPAEEKLHPSWAAKKVKLIQPFQGKKIKFDD